MKGGEEQSLQRVFTGFRGVLVFVQFIKQQQIIQEEAAEEAKAAAAGKGKKTAAAAAAAIPAPAEETVPREDLEKMIATIFVEGKGFMRALIFHLECMYTAANCMQGGKSIPLCCCCC